MDKFERDYATRRLAGLISTAQDDSDLELQALIEDASSLLALLAGQASSGRLTRIITFDSSTLKEIWVTLGDTPMETEDYGMVLGAQTWGGACAMADMSVEDPAQFGIPDRSGSALLRFRNWGCRSYHISFVLVDSQIVQSVFQSTVLKNLQANVEANFSESSGGLVHVRPVPLDWSKLSAYDLQRTILGSFDVLVGADTIYERQHAFS